MMNKFFLTISILVFSACNTSDYIWFAGGLEEAKAKAEDKLILLDFYTDS